MPAQNHVLIVDDDADLRALMRAAFSTAGYRVDMAEDGEAALAMLVQHGYHLVITDLNMPGLSGTEVVAYIREHTPQTPVIVLTGFGSVDTAVEVMRAGAYDYIEKPLKLEMLKLAAARALDKAALDHAYNYLRHEQPYIYRLNEIIAESPAMREVIGQVEKVAPNEATVLLTGETGTGKSLIAGAIHFNSPRRAGNLVTVNCAALSENLLESELFGHEKGAFTGAHKARTGRFQQAHGGTLFLDEVGDMSPALQAKVLRAIEDKVIERVGGGRSIEVDVRIIAATNRELARAVEAGEFREDLYYRLRVAIIHTPPLRRRQEDILPLANLFLRRVCAESKKKPKPFSPEAEAALAAHDWPGNIREVRNAVERALIFSTGSKLTPADLDLQRAETKCGRPSMGDTLDLAELERRAIVCALERAGWVQRKAAELLGISPRALCYKLDKIGLEDPRLRTRRRN